MTPFDFAATLEAAFQRHGHFFRPGQVLSYVEACWSLIAANPEPGYWSERFIETQWLRAGA
jgi:hypothetical protein